MLPNLTSIGEQCENHMSQANKVEKKVCPIYGRDVVNAVEYFFFLIRKTFKILRI